MHADVDASPLSAIREESNCALRVTAEFTLDGQRNCVMLRLQPGWLVVAIQHERRCVQTAKASSDVSDNCEKEFDIGLQQVDHALAQQTHQRMALSSGIL